MTSNGHLRTAVSDNRYDASCVTWKAVLILCFLLFPLIAGAGSIEGFHDDEGCLICHKYPRMSRITDEGAYRSYYVMPDVFANTVHRNVPCRDCHNYIKELPHRPVKEGVRCDTQCHSIKNPATGEPFSHGAIYNAYRKSVHGRPKIAQGLNSDKPYCVTCHNNPIYDPGEPGPPERIVNRCVLCHEDRQFVVQWYKHTSRRIREVRRTPAEIVQLCSSCHGDERLVARHVKQAREEGRPLGKKFDVAVESYLESFHGKLTGYGFQKTANCLDCHANIENYYKSVHEILPSREPAAPTNIENRVHTCRRCHTTADANYAALDPHPVARPGDGTFRYYAEKVYNLISIITIVGLVGLSLFETIGRRRDGVAFRLSRGSSWRRRSKRGRDRVV